MSRLNEVCAGGSHSEVGLAIGRRFGEQIQRALDGYRFLHEGLLPYHQSPAGQARYRELVQLHRERYPDYMAELEGIAEGAGRSFEEMFLVNLRGEYTGYLRGPVRGCSDCAVVTDEVALFGHNEDGSPAFRENVYLVHAEVDGVASFTALSYPGFLCGNAFGFNTEGICFSVDNVRPKTTQVGVGRHFVARSLLEARSVEDAVARVTVPDRASGFGYTIGSVRERRIVYVEVAPAAHTVREIRGTYYHANHYRELGVEQVIRPSSRARVERADALLRTLAAPDAARVLTLLGDEVGGQYPIYRTGAPPDTDATLCTVLFDLDARRMRIYRAHPVRAAADSVEFPL